MEAIRKLIEDVTWEINSGERLSRGHMIDAVRAASDELATIETKATPDLVDYLAEVACLEREYARDVLGVIVRRLEAIKQS